MRASVLVVCGLLATCTSASADQAGKAKPGFEMGDEVVLTGTVIACEWDQIKRLEALASDMEAYKKYIAASLMQDRCRVFRSGSRLVVGKSAWMTNAILVRQKGDITDWWAVSGVLRDSARKAN